MPEESALSATWRVHLATGCGASRRRSGRFVDAFHLGAKPSDGATAALPLGRLIRLGRHNLVRTANCESQAARHTKGGSSSCCCGRSCLSELLIEMVQLASREPKREREREVPLRSRLQRNGVCLPSSDKGKQTQRPSIRRNWSRVQLWRSRRLQSASNLRRLSLERSGA